jgi:anti-sigma factor RsiW
MNCSDVRARLPALLYGDLGPEEKARLDQHLTACPACRRELAALSQVRRLLEAVPAPAVEVDLPQLYHQLADRQASRARCWQRAAVALGGVAALVALALGLHLEVRLEAHQVVLRWGAPPALPQVQGPRAAAAEAPLLAAVEEQVQVLSQLIHALESDVQGRDRRHQGELARLRERLEEVRQQSLRQWTATKHQLDALDTALFVLPKKGALP